MLFAVLVSGVLLAIAISIGNISLKELIISNTIRESQAAFYAADSGMEKALYEDLVSNISTNVTRTLETLYFSDRADKQNGPCAEVTITKIVEPSGIVTTIESRGYNTCDTNNARQVERGLRVTYKQ